MNSRTSILALVALALLVILAGLPGVNRTLRAAPASESEGPIEVAMDWSGQPALNGSVTLTVKVTPLVQTDNLFLHWSLPDGVSLAGPTEESLGPADAGQTITRQRDVTFDQTGTFKVAVGANFETRDPPAIWADADALFFTIRRGLGSKVSRRGPRLASTRERIDTPDVQFIASNRPNGAFYVYGYFYFEDIPTNVDPCPGTAVHVPARNVLVEIWEDDTVGDDFEGAVRTNDDGYFIFLVPDNDDGPLGGDKEIYLEIYPNTSGGYVSDISWIDEDYLCETPEHQGGQDINFGNMSPATFDPMFNIADALLDGWRYAKQYRNPVEQVQALYEPGYGEPDTYYDRYWEEITVGDSGDHPDPYNDAVILHEYGHHISNLYSCNESEGGNHEADKHYSDALAWAEGWAHYVSAAVSDRPTKTLMLADGTCASRDWEGWTVTGSNNEGAVAATLWDIHDSANETYDRMGMGGHHIWYTYDALMEDSDSCEIEDFWDEWVGAGYFADSEFAALFSEHGTGIDGATAGQIQSSVRPVAVRPAAAHTTTDNSAYPPDDPGGRTEESWPGFFFQGKKVPWNAVLFLVDATNSMADEISPILQIIQNKISSMDAELYPYEYAIETFQDNGQNTFVADHFFPDIVNPPVGNIVVGGGGDPEEDSFAALARGSIRYPGYDSWLFTDGAPKYLVSEAALEGLLQIREVTPYFFIFGDCSGGNAAAMPAGGTPTMAESRPRTVPPGRSNLPRFAPTGIEDCIEPYLLVASGTNGQFLFIDTSQVDDAAEIVRAFMNNSAGSGRYSDYVSNTWIYMWEDTDYDWYDATAGGNYHDIIDHEAVALPSSFTFYNMLYDNVYVAAPGYVSFHDFPANSNNTGIPTTALPNNAIYAFWDAISAYQGPPAGSPEQIGGIYTDYDTTNDRFVIEYYEAYHFGSPADYETFEILLDYATGDIIMQYAQVTDDSSCTVGVENVSGTVATQVCEEICDLYDGRAIKFTPMPPQPTRDHEVLVDSLMSNVIFLLNGYSGNVDLTVYDPDGNPIDPSDPNVTFLDVGKVKYYRVNLPAVGTWTAQASGNGTYYFTSATTGPLTLSFLGDLTMGSLGANPILVDLGMSLTVQPQFSLIYPNGAHFDNLDLYDDGAHDDGAAGDGVYGGSYTTPEPGTFYLQVEGQNPSGEAFRRTDLVPIRFQETWMLPQLPDEKFAMPGDTVAHTVVLTNLTPSYQVFQLDVDSSQGWAESWPWVMVEPYNWRTIPVTITIPVNADNVIEETVLTARRDGIADNATVRTIVRGPVDTVDLHATPKRIAPDGYQARIIAQVTDAKGWGVADGTEVTFQTSLGTVAPLVVTTIDGTVVTTLTSGVATGDAIVQGTADGVTGVITVVISPVEAHTLTLAAASNQLPPDGTSTTLLTAQVYDKYGEPAPDGTLVVFSVEGDDMLMGSIEGQQVYSTTASGGVATATYRTGTILGRAFVRAELPMGQPFGPGERVGRNRWARTTIQLGCQIYLPLVVKND